MRFQLRYRAKNLLRGHRPHGLPHVRTGAVKISDIKKIGVKKLTEKYGVTEDAIYSRMLLSNMRAQS